MAKRTTTNKRYDVIVSEFKNISKDKNISNDEVYHQLADKYNYSISTIRRIVSERINYRTIEEVFEPQPQKIVLEITLKNIK